MGKKKSVVLMVLISIVLIALTVFTVCPGFWFPWNDGLKGWNSVLAEKVDFGSDYEDGYYAYYYPKGVISEAEYKDNLRDKDADEAKEYEERHIKYGGLYLDKEADFITEKNSVSSEFEAEMVELRDLIADRYVQKGYTQYSVSLVDKYAIRVEVPAWDVEFASENNMANTMQTFAEMGVLTIKVKGEVVEELTAEGATAAQFIKEFSLRSHFSNKYIHVKLTKAGADLIKRLEAEADSIVSQTAGASDTSGTTGLWIYVGDTPMLPVFTENLASNTVLKCSHSYAEYADFLQTNVVLLNSSLKHDGFSFEFSEVSGEIRQKADSDYDNVASATLIVLGALTVAAIVAAIILCKKYGVVFGYMAFTYVTITGLCFSFISAKIFEFTLGSALVYALGLAVMFLLHVKNYKEIKTAAELGKTVNSAVAFGYKKTLWTTVDVYVVLALGALALALGLAGVSALAWQALICVVAGAFCNLLWGRVINYTYLSASKDKYKFYGLVREDDDDE